MTLAILPLHASERKLASPDGHIEIVISDTNGLHYQIRMDGKPVLVDSHLGMTFENGLEIGDKPEIEGEEVNSHDSTWTNPFGKRKLIRDHYNELHLKIQESGDHRLQYGLILRAYDDGVAFRYNLPKQEDFDTFTVTKENTQFAFPEDDRSWLGDPSDCAECQYPEKKLSQVTGGQHTLPLLVAEPGAFVAITESDLIDWAGLFLSRGEDKDRFIMCADLSPRRDHHGLVVSQTPRVSPWRVIMLGRKIGDLYTSCLVENLATPSKIADISWIHPGITAWDPWWSNLVETRGTTATDKPYIDLASTMGWSYQLVDWGWNQGDDVTPGQVDVPGLVSYAEDKKVGLLLWMHNQDLNKTGIDKAFSNAAKWGVKGLKIDFMNSNSQEMVDWYYSTLEKAAQYKLMIDFHGAYVPTGLARTWPNYITQEGVRGNEYNKGWNHGDKPTPTHTLSLAFTRALLGPMDFTPGGFHNATPQKFTDDSNKADDHNTQVMGSRARQLAMTVIYPSPLLCLCDSPKSYINQSGVEFFRNLPTVWDETLVPSAEIAHHIVVARQSGSNWYLAAMNEDEELTINVSLKFLGDGNWKVHCFADSIDGSNPREIVESDQEVTAVSSLSLHLSPAGGFAAILSHK